MKLTLRKTLCCLLAAATVFPLAACSNNEQKETEPSKETTPSADNSQSTESETEEEKVDLYADLGEANYNDYTFRILTTEEYTPYIFAQDQTGETVNDAVYDANRKVEDLAHIKFATVLVDDPNPYFTQSVTSNGNDFDIAMDHDNHTASRQLAGNYMLNLREFPHINWEGKWWPEFTVDALTFRDQMYFYSNYSTYLGNWMTRVMMCNYGELKSRNLEDPYQLVYENKWTLDKLIEMTSDVYDDRNGDTKKDVEDFYGFGFTGTFYCWLEAWNYEVFQKNDEGGIDINVEDEKLVTTLEKMYNWLHDSQGVYLSQKDSGNFERDNYLGIFANDSSLFAYGLIGRLLKACVETDVEYAILPMPMMDESVGKYYSGTTDRPISVPVTAQDYDMLGYVIEAMAIAGYEKILPAYCDSALKGRYSIDKDSSAMIDIIFENRILGFSYMYVNAATSNGYPLLVNQLMYENSFNYSSTIKKGQKLNEKGVENIITAYERNSAE